MNREAPHDNGQFHDLQMEAPPVIEGASLSGTKLGVIPLQAGAEQEMQNSLAREQAASVANVRRQLRGHLGHH